MGSRGVTRSWLAGVFCRHESVESSAPLRSSHHGEVQDFGALNMTKSKATHSNTTGKRSSCLVTSNSHSPRMCLLYILRSVLRGHYLSMRNILDLYSECMRYILRSVLCRHYNFMQNILALYGVCILNIRSNVLCCHHKSLQNILGLYRECIIYILRSVLCGHYKSTQNILALYRECILYTEECPVWSL